MAGKGFGGMGTLLPFGRESSVRERKTHHLGGGVGLAGGEMTARGMRRARRKVRHASLASYHHLRQRAQGNLLVYDSVSTMSSPSSS